MRPTEETLLEMLSEHNVTFFIPPYQRNYEWTKEQCEAFFSDIKETYKGNTKGNNTEHFFGAITFFVDDHHYTGLNNLVLIDGQQRITTTMLFLLAIRDLSESDEGIRNTIDNRYLTNKEQGNNNEHKIKLKQVETDWDAYKSLIIGEELTKTQKESRVYKNYSFFLKKLEDMKSNGCVLFELIDKGLLKFKVVSIELEPKKNPWENPQEIFESMNSLGKPLSLADLVRNYLLLGKNADEQTDLYSKYWLKVEKRIPGRVSDFVRDFMQMTESKSFKKSTEGNYKLLYSQFKDIYKHKKIDKLLDNFTKTSRIYAYIQCIDETGVQKIDLILRDLNILKITTANSLLMSILKLWKEDKLNSTEVVDVLDVIRNYFLRRRILGINSAENKVLPTLSKPIEELESTDDKRLFMFEILSSLENSVRFPNDVEISKHLETMNFYNFRYCKFFLALIEEKITKIRPDINNNEIQIEHIMPQTIGSAWKDSLGNNYEEIHSEYVNTIGNLTLIQFNQELGNKTFSEKKKIYEDRAGLQIAKTEITNNNIWNEESIINRQIWITDFLLNYVFPLPEKMKKANNYRIKEGKRSKNFSFEEHGLIGKTICFNDDTSITAKVISDREVEFESKIWSLSPLTKEIYKRKGNLRPSGSYQGPAHWEYNGTTLTEIDS